MGLVPPPNQPVLVYDGDCAFCTRTARWIEARLPSNVRVAPSQALDLDALGLSEHDVATAAWWVDATGRRWRGHEAVAQALRAAGGWERPVGRLLLTPPISWVAAAAYGWVARNRSKMPGGTPSCHVDERPQRPIRS